MPVCIQQHWKTVQWPNRHTNILLSLLAYHNYTRPSHIHRGYPQDNQQKGDRSAGRKWPPTCPPHPHWRYCNQFTSTYKVELQNGTVGSICHTYRSTLQKHCSGRKEHQQCCKRPEYLYLESSKRNHPRRSHQGLYSMLHIVNLHRPGRKQKLPQSTKQPEVT